MLFIYRSIVSALVTCDLRFVPAAVDVLTAMNNDIKLEETRTMHFCVTIYSSFRFERMNTLDRFYSESDFRMTSK